MAAEDKPVRFYRIERKGYLTKWLKGTVDERGAADAYNETFNAYANGRTKPEVSELTELDFEVATRGLPRSPNNGLQLQVINLTPGAPKPVLLRELKRKAEEAKKKEGEAEAARLAVEAAGGQANEDLIAELQLMREQLAVALESVEASNQATAEVKGQLEKLKAEGQKAGKPTDKKEGDKQS